MDEGRGDEQDNDFDWLINSSKGNIFKSLAKYKGQGGAAPGRIG